MINAKPANRAYLPQRFRKQRLRLQRSADRSLRATGRHRPADPDDFECVQRAGPDKNFWPARCFVYQNAENTGIDAAVMFELTCPDSPGGVCNNNQNFFAALGSDFSFEFSDNPYFIDPGIFGLLNPFPGWLKGAGPDPLHPCTPPASGPLFQSNQITAFSVTGDPGGKTVGGSGGTGSCWVATYDMPGEIWPGVTITSPKPTTYT